MKQWQVTGITILGAQFIPLSVENTDRNHRAVRSVRIIISIYSCDIT